MSDEFDETFELDRAAQDGIQQMVVGALVVRPGADRPELLILDRAADDFMGGIEEFPSGKVEANESLVAALARELDEETGLRMARLGPHVFDFDYTSGSGKPTRQLNFLVEVDPGEVTTDPAEHVGHRWISLGSLSSTRLTPNVVEALESHAEVLDLFV